MSKLRIFLMVVFFASVLLIVYHFSRNQGSTFISRILDDSQALFEASKYGLYPKFSKISCPVFYINLDKDKDRKEYMEVQFKKYEVVKAERVPAIYGKDLPNLKKQTDREPKFVNNYPDLSPSELGCTLSHIKAIRKAKETGSEYSLILEDDANFDLLPYWNSSLDDVVKNAPKDWGIIQLFSWTYPETSEFYFKHEPGNYEYSSVAYLISKAGIEKILEYGHSLGPGPPHGYADRYIYDIATTYIYMTPLIFPLNTALESTIHPDHTLGHIQRAFNILHKYEELNREKVDLEQLKMAKTLQDITKELEKNNVKSFLTDGTLLGAFRENRFIRGDSDIDLGCKAAAYTFPNILGRFFKTREFGTLHYGYECTYRDSETGIPVDIFLYYPATDGFWYASYYGLCDESASHMCRWKVPKFELNTIEFMGRKYNIPTNIEDFLQAKYGVNWNIPKHFSYHEGLENAHYRGLILDDFPEDKIQKYREVQNEKKLNDLWPRKLLESDKPIIWLYWQNKNENSVKPGYLDLCLQTIQKTCEKDFRIIVLDDFLVEQLLKTIHKNFRNIEPLGMRADYIRFVVVSEYGGIWLDSDTIVLKSLKFLISDRLKKHNFVGFEHDSLGDLSIGIFGGNRKNKVCLFMKSLFEDDSRYNLWKTQKYTISWASPTKNLPGFLKKFVRIYPDEYAVHYAPETVYPVDWTESERYYWGTSEPDSFSNFSALYLHNEMYTEKEKNLTSEQVLNGNFTISKLLRRVLGEKMKKNAQ